MDLKNKYIDDDSVKILSNLNTSHKTELYYSIEQVATILGESVDKIRYYTNIFDNILKIEILNKELRYKNNDIDKLQLLIKLKNNNMSVCEIEDYYKQLPSDNNGNIEFEESNLLSVNELLKNIVKEQEIQLNKFKENLFNEMEDKIQIVEKNLALSLINDQNKAINNFENNLFETINKVNTVNFSELLETLINKQNDNFKNLKEELILEVNKVTSKKLEEISTQIIETQNSNTTKIINSLSLKFEEYLHSHLQEQTELTKDTLKDINSKIDCFLSDVNKNKTLELHESVDSAFIDFKKDMLNEHENLIRQIQNFKDVITRAYLLQDEVEESRKKSKLFSKLFNRNK